MLEYLGYVAGVLTVVSFLPQVIRAWKTKQVNDLSFGMFALLITAAWSGSPTGWGAPTGR